MDYTLSAGSFADQAHVRWAALTYNWKIVYLFGGVGERYQITIGSAFHWSRNACLAFSGALH